MSMWYLTFAKTVVPAAPVAVVSLEFPHKVQSQMGLLPDSLYV